MKVFIEGVDGYVGSAVRDLLLSDYNAKLAENEGELPEGEEKLVVVGSVSDDCQYTPLGVDQVVKRSDLQALCELAVSANSIVLDLHESVREASAVVKALKHPFEGAKNLVLVSTLLTWNRTLNDKESKMGEEENEDEQGEALSMFREEEFNRRKPSNAFLLHKTLEAQVLALAHDTLSTTILASGLLYGAQENLFQGFFRDAWLGKSAVLPCVNEGCKNIVPMIHVKDLGRAVCTALQEAPSQQYVVAADKSRDTVADIVCAVFTLLQPHPEMVLLKDAAAAAEEEEAESSGEVDPEKRDMWKQYIKSPRVASAVESDAILLKDPSWAQLQNNLVFETSESAVNSLVTSWHSEEGLVANIATIVREFCASRDLRPIRLAVLGPPSSGKTSLSVQAAEEYALPCVTAENALEYVNECLRRIRFEREEKIKAYRAEQARKKEELKRERARERAEAGEEVKEDEDEEEEEPENDEENPEYVQICSKGIVERLAERIALCIEKTGKVSNKLAAKALRVRLLSPECLNQGYVLDGVAKTYQHLKRVYGLASITDGLPTPEDEAGDEPVPEDDFADENDEESLKAQLEESENSEGGEDEAGFVIDKRIIPTAVVTVDAKEDTLRARACEATGESATSSQDFETALAFHRKHNAEHLLRTPLGFFEGRLCKLESLYLPTDRDLVMDEEKLESKEVECVEAKSNQCESKEMDAVVNALTENVMLYIERGGRPFNYHPTEEEIEIKLAKEKSAELLREEVERKKRLETDKQRKQEETGKISSMEEHREQLARHEAAVLETRTQPLRDYLVKHIMPTLSKGLIETCKAKPDDPIDFLAEFLFKNSAET